MQAIVMPVAGGPEVLELREVPDPILTGERDLLIQLRAAGVNPLDTKLRGRGTYGGGEEPAILGCDGAGVVEAAGAGCTRLAPGDEVFFCNGGIGIEPGCYAEYAVVDERWVAAKPPSLDFAEAASLPLVALTAWESLFDQGRLEAGESVLIHAGAGGVGHVAVQLARVAGARILTTVGSEAKARFARDLGAHETIAYRDTDFVEAVRAATGDNGVDLACDIVGPGILEASFPAVRFYGRLVTLHQPKDVDFSLARLRNQAIHLELMLSPMYFGLPQARAHHTEILERCSDLVEEGWLRVHLERTFPLAEAAEAHRVVAEGHTTGKVALTLD